MAVASPASTISRRTPQVTLRPVDVGSGTSIHDGANRLDPTPRPVTHDVARSRYQSPLRYPGAKSALTPVIGRVIGAAKESDQVREVSLLVEPFAGGASTSLRLVGDGAVDRILLADADPLVACFWQTSAADTARLVDRMWDEWRRYVSPGGSTAVERWDYWRCWVPPVGLTPRNRRLEGAMKCLFLNRTTFSGILHGRAGPIGGREQASEYAIGCRWNPDALADRLTYVGHLYETGRLVDVWRKDWRKTLEDIPEYYPQLLPSRVVAYLDPPYLDKSATLYRQSFDPRGGYASGDRASSDERDDGLHLELAAYLRTRAQFRWLLSYDADPRLTASPWLYGLDRMNPTEADRALLNIKRWRISKRLLSTRYSASGKTGKRSADELLLTTLPPATVPVDEKLRPVPTTYDEVS